MLKQQGKSTQLNIEAVAADLKNLTGGVDICFELMTGPLPLFHWATAALCSGRAVETHNQKDRFQKKKHLLKFDASQSHFITTHRFTKVACVPFFVKLEV